MEEISGRYPRVLRPSSSSDQLPKFDPGREASISRFCPLEKGQREVFSIGK